MTDIMQSSINHRVLVKQNGQLENTEMWEQKLEQRVEIVH